ncbi:MAG: MCE family protein, partial [Erythrobacter sp.]|nr:MCE family protein [Erythrobacter sp.]
MLAALALFVVWIARWDEGAQKDYDIFFAESVSGLANGSQVSFAGVPVGQVSEIVLWEKDPGFVRVRIKVKEEVPILVGTTATIQGSFTGVSTILLDGARSGAPPISCETTACTEGVPIIPPKDGGLNALLSNAPLLLERLATLTERLTQLLDEENQGEIAGILANTNQMTAELADAAPQFERTMAELQVTLREASEALDEFENVTASTDRLLNQEGAQLANQLRTTLKQAGDASEELQGVLSEARPAARQLT